ncbi:SLATT domain-containing protein [Campylobacter sp. JMF_08 NE1]|uniref:SLATT domain-containing protein n=1 Tax=Campylobacter sp. JMF_08 NE1 TaxID=2983821 RepID=UPI0022E9AEDF|nr:SLATT domain-containing protein [Campylobacter sp. JMF_08 NE1]MDA3047666.1 SLATT domain-containing protein [Campylobacter sp. JMF_08 NE1]
MDNNDNKIIDEAFRLEEDCTYSAKGHFESAKQWRYLYYMLMLFSIITLMLSISNIFVNFSICHIILNITAGLITVIIIFLNPQEKYISHQNSGNHFLSLRNEIRIFREIEISSLELNQKIEKISFLSKKRDELNINSLPISTYGYENAKKQIETDKNTIYEIDKIKGNKNDNK